MPANDVTITAVFSTGGCFPLRNLGPEGSLTEPQNVFYILDDAMGSWIVAIVKSRLPDPFNTASGWKLELDGTDYVFSLSAGTADTYQISIPKSSASQEEIRDACFSAIAGPQYQVTLAVNPISGGTVTGGGLYSAGDPVTVNALAASGYTFTGWTGTYSSPLNSYTFTMPAANVNLVANFTGSTSQWLDSYEIYINYMNVYSANEYDLTINTNPSAAVASLEFSSDGPTPIPSTAVVSGNTVQLNIITSNTANTLLVTAFDSGHNQIGSAESIPLSTVYAFQVPPAEFNLINSSIGLDYKQYEVEIIVVSPYVARIDLIPSLSASADTLSLPVSGGRVQTSDFTTTYPETTVTVKAFNSGGLQIGSQYLVTLP